TASGECLLEVFAERAGSVNHNRGGRPARHRWRLIRQPEANRDARTAIDLKRIMRRTFCPSQLLVDRLTRAMNDAVVDSVFHKPGMVGNAEEALIISLVFCEQHFRRAFAQQPALLVSGVVGFNHRRILHLKHLSENRTLKTVAPTPRVAKP